MEQDDPVVEALKQIARRHRGYLRPHDVVEEARDEDSPLHGQFDWDDASAGEKHRLWQARMLIRVKVAYESVGNGEEVAFRVFTSLVSDRQAEGGYRVTTNVMADPDLRDELLADALAEMRRFQVKYRHLKELAEVFAAMGSVQAKAGVRQAATQKKVA
jgi:hypothetical protein